MQPVWTNAFTDSQEVVISIKHGEGRYVAGEHTLNELGLGDDEYERIREVLGRRPTQSGWQYSNTWSEHCSYKSSNVHLRHFGDA